ncbi:CatB-related O-acetyltransferase [Priestia megaterium]|uniref:CatB-related O-acetyltransferase n=1 Tax=Priestia megaterium TaxID=1404 RepID=UPI00300AF41F
MRLDKLLIKALKRGSRLIKYRRRVYGMVGKRNKYTNAIFISEDAIVGNFNYFGPRTMINNAVIKNYCSFAPDVKIGQAEHSLNYITTYQPISKKMINHSMNQKPSIIGNDVWCGANVVIRQGIEIGDGAVIGANSVVTKDIPSYAIAVGAPAKIIRYRFNDKQIKLLLDSKWFEDDIEGAMRKIERIEENIEKYRKEQV